MRTRLVLAGFALLMLSAFTAGILLFIYKYPAAMAHNGFMQSVSAFLLLLTPLPFLSSLIMLIFSLFRVEVLPDGTLTYDPRNPYWRLMQRIYKNEWRENISVCKACGLTTLFLFGSLFGLFLVSSLSFVAWLCFHGELRGIDWSKVVRPSIWLASFIIPVLVGKELFFWGHEKESKVLKCLGRLILWIWGISFFIILPIPVVMDKEHLGLFLAILFYLKWVAIMVAAVLSLFGLMTLLFWLAENTIMGQWFRAWKNDFCPILNPVSKEEKG